jgi:molybdate transport system substrate-binding protein
VRPTPRILRPLLAAGAATLSAVLLAGCVDGSGGSTAAGSAGRAADITVLAAASLSDAFGALGEQFEAANPGATVTFSFGASSALATQIGQGAPADVFASASQKTMEGVVEAGLAGSSTPFVTNRMQVAVPPGNPAGITGLADLAKDGVTVALCQVEVPCGAVAAEVFANAGLTVRPVTEESDVKATLAKVILGEVDAAVVYVTDVLAAGDQVEGIEIPTDVNASTTYPIAPLTASRNAALAQAFVDHVLSPDGQKVLAGAGFSAP